MIIVSSWNGKGGSNRAHFRTACSSRKMTAWESVGSWDGTTMNRSTTSPPEPSSRWAGQDVLKEIFGKNGTATSSRNGTVPGNESAASALCGSQLTSEFSSCYYSFPESFSVCECAFASRWARVSSAGFARIGRDVFRIFKLIEWLCRYCNANVSGRENSAVRVADRKDRVDWKERAWNP